MIVTDLDGLGDLRSVPLTDAPVQDLALVDQVVHRPTRFDQRGVLVIAVALIQIDVIRIEALQRRVALREEVLASQAAVIGPGEGPIPFKTPVHLRGQYIGVAAKWGQRLADEDLRLAPPVDVGGIEEVDTVLVGGAM